MPKALLLFSIFLVSNSALAEWAPVVCEGPRSPLFQSEETLDLSIKGEFPIPVGMESQHYAPRPAEISYEGAPILSLTVQSRGRTRADLCVFSPLRLIWNEDDDLRKNTVFDRLKGKSIKLVTHCEYTSGNIADHLEANEDVLREYALYKILESFDLPTYKVRLAKIRYNNPDGSFQVEGMGFFVEPNNSVNKRCDLKDVDENDIAKSRQQMDPRVDLQMLLARLIVDARDFGLENGHNSDHFADATGVTKLILPYDFNDSSLVMSRGVKWADFFHDKLTFDTFDLLSKGPFNRRGELREISETDLVYWRSSVVTISNSVLSRVQATHEKIDTLPLNEESRQEFHEHLNATKLRIEKMLSSLK